MKNYEGFEVGAIRPPSESDSLLLRVTRNCPWNNCKFCTLYKGTKFSIRSKEHVFRDIDMIRKCIDTFEEIGKVDKKEGQKMLAQLQASLDKKDYWALHSALRWYNGGMESIFLQDANSMVIKPDDMVDILNYINKNFPNVKRITSYARSQTVARISDEDLARISDAGLNRIHIGMESGADEVLEAVKKGVDKETHILAGQKIKKTNMQLSEYYMPGLGGNEFSDKNAIETADAINKINPDFIRLRTSAVKDDSQLSEDYKNGTFTRTNDTKMVEEILLFVKNLEGITSTLKSDHILNLIPEVEGKFPEDKDKILSALVWYLKLSSKDKMIFRIGRRTGHFESMNDLYDEVKKLNVIEIIKSNKINEENVDIIVDELMKRFI